MSTASPSRRSSALGIDLSTHAVHMALVGRDAVIATAAVRLDKLTLARQLEGLSRALQELLREPGTLALIERPYYGHDNPDTAIKLARIMGIVEAMCALRGYRTRTMTASEWRPLAGISLTVPKGYSRRQRAQLKNDAKRLVKLEFGIDTTDDNLAEAILIGRVALGLDRGGQS